MDLLKVADDEYNVQSDAFWHVNMNLYYGYQNGEIVEVEHETNKYWLASIVYSFEHLILLKWIGNYGEFWVDTSWQSLSTGSNTTSFNELNMQPRRLFPPGYHMQSLYKSQYKLERPSKVLIKPSLYNPANDPYAEIKTVDDLLAHEITSNQDDSFSDRTLPTETTSIALAKCNTKISYGQEDADELTTALQNLDDADSNNIEDKSESPDTCNAVDAINATINNITKQEDEDTKVNHDTSTYNSDRADARDITNQPIGQVQNKFLAGNLKKELIGAGGDETKIQEDKDKTNLDTCKRVQDSALSKGRYIGLDKNNKKVYFLKPKQFFDLGGANQDRVFVPGTLLEVCHTIEDRETGRLELYHWFATILRNVGGRLTLRWFICDEPKFKQGRLELKSILSKYIREDDGLPEASDEDLPQDRAEYYTAAKNRLSTQGITFCMYFCNPNIHSIADVTKTKRPYEFPNKLGSFLRDLQSAEEIEHLKQNQISHVLNSRRINLDKDRPIIDHILSTARWSMPQYVNITFASRDKDSRREVLIASPKMTRLLRGHVVREIDAGVYEVHSEPIGLNGEVIKFIYPYDSSYAVLPSCWAVNNEDCISVHPSRNPSPTVDEQSSVKSSIKLEVNGTIKEEEEEDEEEVKICDNGVAKSEATVDEKPVKSNELEEPKEDPAISEQPRLATDYTLLCEIVKLNNDTYDETPKTKTDIANSISGSPIIERRESFDELDPACWSKLLRTRQQNASKFGCTLDLSSQEFVQSKFKVMDQLEVVHPSSDVSLCTGRIRKVVYPLIWIQISADSYTMLPFNSTEIYPSGWCESNHHQIVTLLPPRKRLNQAPANQSDKKRKKSKNNKCDNLERQLNNLQNQQRDLYEKEHFDLDALNNKQLDLEYILSEDTNFIRIYFNHKCFTGPSLSKVKICSLPQYVGPGPLRLVIEEVMTKLISVAYVPPRVLNELSSKSFEELLIARNLTNLVHMKFKAKYQKRVHREDVPVCLNVEDVTLYCECVCEHLKCCYYLFGPNSYDGEDCPGHCRALTKSNKFMKRATYYRDKARSGEFTSDGGSSKKITAMSSNIDGDASGKSSRPRYGGRDSFESTGSSVSQQEQHSQASSVTGLENGRGSNDLKENLTFIDDLIS